MASNIATNTTYRDYLKPLSSRNFTFKNVTELEIDKIIKPLTLINNQSLHTGIIPQKN